MSLKLGLNIFNKQWLIEPQAALQMLDFWTRMGEADGWDYKRAKGEEGESEDTGAVYNKFFEGSSVKMAPTRSWQIPDFSFEGAKVAIIPVMGPMMKADYCGDLGTASLKMVTQLAERTESVQTIIFLNDSPGGTVDGTKAFADVIAGCKKRTVSLVDGLMCSANYWTGSSAKELYALNQTDIIGSIGTMCSWYDGTGYLEKKGIVLREYYATESKDKNRMFTEASKGDGKKLIAEMLDPMNDLFLGAVRMNRGGKIDTDKENVLTGNTYMAARAKEVGLIDDVVSFEEVLEDALSATNKTTIFFNKNTNTDNTMATEIKTVAELRAAYPELCSQIATEGNAAAVKIAMDAERDRVGAWAELYEADPAAVTEGITTGKTLGKTDMVKLLGKMYNKHELKDREDDNAEEVETDPEAAGQGDVKKTAADSFFAEVRKNVKESMV